MWILLMPHCRVAALPRCRTAARLLTFENKSEIKQEKPCISPEKFVPLHCQNECRKNGYLTTKIARIKSRICAT